MAAKAALPVENTPVTFGIEFNEPYKLNRLNLLRNREIKSTKWTCPHILNQLGLRHDFNYICNNFGLLHFVFQEATIYRRWTLEFLRTLTHTMGRFHASEEDNPE
jgi:hypothetical protein